MNKKIKIITLISLIITTVTTISIAAWGTGGGLEAELPTYYPPTDTMTLPNTYPADASNPNLPDDETVVENNLIIERRSSISGVAFEDYQQITEINNAGGKGVLKTERITTNRKKDELTEKTDKEPGIANVVVELLKDGSVIETVLTDIEGKFAFKNIGETHGAGKYRLRFYYGLVNHTDYLPESSTEYILPEDNNLILNQGNLNEYYKTIKNIVKYNAQDYTATQVGDKYYTYDLFKRKILESGKAYSQVILLLDCSGSIAENSEEIFKLEKEAAKETINNLLRDEKTNDNIAIGIVGFYNDVVLAKQLTNIKSDLIQCLDSMTLDPATATADPSIEIIAVNNFMNWNHKPYGTNIGHALLETNKLFITDTNNMEDSNRTIVLLSDGYPSAHNNVEQLYVNDNNLYDKFLRVADETNKNIKELLDTGTKLISVIAKPDSSDTYAREFIDKTFKNDEGYMGYYKEISLGNQDEYKEYIGNEIPAIVEVEQKEGNILSDTTEQGILNEFSRLVSSTIENTERRIAINEYFSTIDNEKANWFNTIDKLTGDMSDLGVIQGGATAYKNYIKEFTAKTFMFIESNEYEINIVEESDDTVTVIDSNGETSYNRADYDNNIEVIDKNHENENLVLEKRSEFKLSLEKKVTGVRVTLADGTILKEDIRTDFSDITNFGMLTYPVVMDEEIIHGAKLELEFTIRITNLSATNIQTGREIAIIDYINEQGSKLQFDLNTHLLSEPQKTNNYYLWKTVNKDYLTNNKLINNDVLENLSDSGEYLIAKYNINDYNNSYIADGNNTYPINPIIPKNGHIDVKLVGNTILTSGLEEDSLTYTNTAEILSYSNFIGRRIDYELNKNEVDSGLEKHIIFLSDEPSKSVTPGNYKIGDVHEIDSNESVEVVIIPPLGNKMKQYVLPISLGIVFVVGLIFIKKKVLK